MNKKLSVALNVLLYAAGFPVLFKSVEVNMSDKIVFNGDKI